MVTNVKNMFSKINSLIQYDIVFYVGFNMIIILVQPITQNFIVSFVVDLKTALKIFLVNSSE